MSDDQNLKPVYALIGPDPLLQLENLTLLVRLAGANVQRVDLDGEDAALAQVLDEVRTLPMFGPGKIVVLRNADDFISSFREPLERYVSGATGAGNATLVLRVSTLPSNQKIYKLIQKFGQVVDCKPPKNVPELVQWASKRSRELYSAILAPDAGALLIDMIGNDLSRLDQELAKLSLQSPGAINVDAVRQGVAFQREQEMWDMTDAVASGKTAQAITRWRQLVRMDPSTEFRAVTWLTIWLEKVRKAIDLKKKGQNDFAIGKQLQIWKDQSQFVSTAMKLGEARAGRLVKLLARIDLQSKTGIGNMADNVERFLITVAAD